MGRILAEKILSSKSASDLKAGDIAISTVDLIFVQDVTGPVDVPQFEALGFKTLANPERTLVFMTHASSSTSREASNLLIYSPENSYVSVRTEPVEVRNLYSRSCFDYAQHERLSCHFRTSW